jgi:hypothetical protein
MAGHWVSSDVSIRKIATAEMCTDEAVHIGTPIENSAVDPDVRAAAPFGAFAVQFAQRTPSVDRTFLWGE